MALVQSLEASDDSCGSWLASDLCVRLYRNVRTPEQRLAELGCAERRPFHVTPTAET